jgi:hypothetical protein
MSSLFTIRVSPSLPHLSSRSLTKMSLYPPTPTYHLKPGQVHLEHLQYMYCRVAIGRYGKIKLNSSQSKTRNAISPQKFRQAYFNVQEASDHIASTVLTQKSRLSKELDCDRSSAISKTEFLWQAWRHLVMSDEYGRYGCHTSQTAHKSSVFCTVSVSQWPPTFCTELWRGHCIYFYWLFRILACINRAICIDL